MKNKARIIGLAVLLLASITVRAQSSADMVASVKTNLIRAIQEGKAMDAVNYSQTLVNLQAGEVLEAYAGIFREFQPQIQSLGPVIKAMAAQELSSTNATETQKVFFDWLNATNKEAAVKAISRLPAASEKDRVRRVEEEKAYNRYQVPVK